MRELVRTNDMVLISWAEAILADLGIPCVVLDSHMSVVEGSLGILPRRLMVDREDFDAAQRGLRAAHPDGVFPP